MAAKKDDKKDEMLLTEKEFQDKYEKELRLKRKEKINRVLRIFGLGAILIVAFAGLLDPLFETTYFGWIWDQMHNTTDFTEFWSAMASTAIYDDYFYFGTWLPELAFTLVYMCILLAIVYLLTYNIVDLIEFVKGLVAAGKDITKDLSNNVTEGGTPEALGLDKKRKKLHFDWFKKSDKPVKDLNDKPADTAKKEKKSKKKDDDLMSNLSSDQLDALLSGQSLPPAVEETLDPLPEIKIETVKAKDVVSK